MFFVGASGYAGGSLSAIEIKSLNSDEPISFFAKYFNR